MTDLLLHSTVSNGPVNPLAQGRGRLNEALHKPATDQAPENLRATGK